MKRNTAVKLAALSMVAPVLALAGASSAFAHVVVSPKTAPAGAYETFTTSVPNEKDISVTGIRVVVPDGVESVTPTVKPGWEIQTKKTGEKVTEISWTGGSIGPELRDTFTFSARVAAESGEINWKAYQTYQDGSVAAWDQKPAEDGHGHGDAEGKGPYSTTVVTDDAEETSDTHKESPDVAPYVVSFAALALSTFALIRTTKK